MWKGYTPVSKTFISEKIRNKSEFEMCRHPKLGLHSNLTVIFIEEQKHWKDKISYVLNVSKYKSTKTWLNAHDPSKSFFKKYPAVPSLYYTGRGFHQRALSPFHVPAQAEEPGLAENRGVKSVPLWGSTGRPDWVATAVWAQGRHREHKADGFPWSRAPWLRAQAALGQLDEQSAQ